MSEKGGVFYRNRVIITHRSVEQEKKVPRNQEVAPSFPIFHWQFVVLIKWSCCAPNFDIGLALMVFIICVVVEGKQQENMLIDILCSLNVNRPLDSRLLGLPDQKDGRSVQGGSFQVWIFTQPPFWYRILYTARTRPGVNCEEVYSNPQETIV